MVSPVPVTPKPHIFNPARGKKRKRTQKEKTPEEIYVELEEQENTDSSWSGITDDEEELDGEERKRRSKRSQLECGIWQYHMVFQRKTGPPPSRLTPQEPEEQRSETQNRTSKPSEGRRRSSRHEPHSRDAAPTWRKILQDREAVDKRKQNAKKITPEIWKFYMETKASFEEYVQEESENRGLWGRHTIIDHCKNYIRLLPLRGVTASALWQSKDALKYLCSSKTKEFSRLQASWDLEITAQVEQTIFEDDLEDSEESEESSSEVPTPTIPLGPTRRAADFVDLTIDTPDVKDEEVDVNKHTVHEIQCHEGSAPEEEGCDGDAYQVDADSPSNTVINPAHSEMDQETPPNADESDDELYRPPPPVENVLSRNALRSSAAHSRNVDPGSGAAAEINSTDPILQPNSKDSDESTTVDHAGDASDACMDESYHDEDDLDEEEDDEGPVGLSGRRHMSSEIAQYDSHDVPRATTSDDDMQGITASTISQCAPKQFPFQFTELSCSCSSLSCGCAR
ncbi:uncharacterized protein BDZ99DRAFT_571916 [Mytilinidion resinicola]|uniref:Uncharacterized protein n=1 Tax=Mytilinidion resinicola TaxID=574789 RepID=A0A6A6YJX6_9PEZI|nr:uncharacterized protein BDZ99DRAFT_571916 [Mytilinidion resinicola]KAF2809090.1 hypothetical protein BDZ99DRAFT_571916 [Mytilinidion resinicola]